MVTWQIENGISSLSQGLWTPNLAGWWFWMRGSHPHSHVTHQPSGYVTIKKWYISTFTRPVDPKLSKVLTQHEWVPKNVVTWQFENVIFPQPQGLWPLNLAGYVLRLRGRLTKARWHFCFVVTLQKLHFHFYFHFHIAYGLWDWLRMREHHLKNLQFTWHFHHLTNWKRYA